ncbi:SusC/RagA family TonB-linked outer membrane protein [Lutimonas zeaxanthinifaciens]|uniref:SusC/RagA family TonB-linked outer membrane protein n=1 Tax=Lutimonas zeaxanthinifaciens TaxID=3060215 RepID=UPI00265C9A68|nr:TonB-dependent receptor [Lutimonas sp. YSD2104]WKK66443.1 TonB-dependent receptor [Lutimonas sp. YSD2104]
MNLKATLILVVALLLNIPLIAQNTFPLSGTVTAETDGSPIPGVSVLIVNTTDGVITDFDGNFQIEVKSGDQLKISYLGYVSQTITIENQTTLNVALAEDMNQLDEVVLIGYGTQKKSHLTGAISKVTNENLDQIAVPRVDDALVGQVSGVNIQQTSGEAGAAPTIRIRGTGSVSGVSGPLIVVDGAIVDNDFLTNMDMNDIESFEVLKDAASAAIFGARGGNGVIQITTKQGKEGKTIFSFNHYTGVKTARKSDAYDFSVTDWAAAELAANGFLSDRTLVKQQLGVDQDWQDIIFDGGIITNTALSVRGGSEKTQFSTALSYLHDEGVLLTDDFKKYNIKLRVDTKFNDRFSAGGSLTTSYSDTRRMDGSTHDITRQPPWLPLYLDENTIQFVNRLRDNGLYSDAQIGDYAIQRMFDDWDLETGMPVASGGTDISNTSNTNPGAKVLERERLDKKFKMNGRFYGQWNIIDGLSLRSTLSGDFQNTRRTRWQGVESSRNGAAAASSQDRNEEQIHLIWDNILSYNKVFDEVHELGAIVGTSIEGYNNYYSSITGTGYESDDVQTINNASTIASATSFMWEKRNHSYFARANYAYKDKYLFSASFRREGSSIFGSDTKYGSFPAISAGWNISNEDFLRDSKAVSYLKLRVSYGVTGNDRLNTGNVNPNVSSGNNSLSTGNVMIDYYPSYALLGANTAVINGAIVSGFDPLNISNPQLQWERSVEINPGIDFGFINNRITGSLDYYNRTSDELLLNNPISATNGKTNALVNIGEVENKGVEFELRTKNIVQENFSWSSMVIVSHNKNTLKDFADSNGLITNVDSKRAAEWINIEGEPISSFYGWVVDRDIPLEYINNPWHPIGGEAQDVYVRDLNGDGLIDDDDKTILGDPYPDIIWSFTNTFKLGDFDLSFMFQGSHGAKVRNMGDQYIFNHFNSSQDFDPAITPDQEFIKQKIFTDDIIQDASYVTLRNVNLGFNFPREWMDRTNVFSRGRIYLSGQNLIYMTADDYTGYNPESIDNTSSTTLGYQRAGAPVFSTVSLGFNLQF